MESDRSEKIVLGKKAREFFEKGARIGTQRMRAIAAARNALTMEFPEDEVIELVWQGLQKSPQDPKKPWMREDVVKLVKSIASKPAPPIKPLW